ncbi:TfoX/Sxy family protein [Nakamurella sp.]|uniref:TfoX/Sxy family protein n=1 Tax=Nakamurella sp. TaxID=1869182 RepID=UPI003782F963
MAYDEDMAARIRDILAPERGLSEKRMFGGLAFLLEGHMTVAVSGQGGLLLRIDPSRADELVAGPHVDRMVMRGREMNGWLLVAPAAVDTEEQLTEWVGLGVAFVRTLPPK